MKHCSENGLGKQHHWFGQYVASKAEGMAPV